MLKEYLKSNFIYLDGGMGTLLQEKGLAVGELPERWNITHSQTVTEIHKAYFDAGSNIVSTNTFGANLLKFTEDELEEIIKNAVLNAKTALKESKGTQKKWVALDIGPTGRMLAPYGDLDFEEAVKVFSATVRLGVKYGVDLIFIETMTDGYETKAAVLAAKENSNLPIFVSNAYGEDGCLLTGADPRSMIATLEGLGVDAIGVNCSFGPKKLAPIVQEYLKYSSLPIILKPNAGLPKTEMGKTVFSVGKKEFALDVCQLMEKGVRVVGGCCGTTPKHIQALVENSCECKALPVCKKDWSAVSSYTHAVELGKTPVLIGERINPTGKKKFKEALRLNDIDYLLKEGIAQEERGAHILDVNVGLPEIDEVKMMEEVVCRLQAIVDLPLQIDTCDFTAMERALRRYNGKAMVNSVNGKKESMEKVFPLVKKYGGVVVCLTLDEQGIPKTAEERVKIAKNILDEAKKYGIEKKDLIFDPLVMTVSADEGAAKETLKAVKLISKELGANTSLGISNVSFGLPNRDVINGAFFALALNQGLSAAIINPYSAEVMKAYHAFLALNGQDKNFEAYIKFVQTIPEQALPIENKVAEKSGAEESASRLQTAIKKGLKEEAAAITKELLCSVQPLEIVQREIIPALNAVGVGFENKTVYLPQLLMSAEASKAAFEQIKEKMQGQVAADKCPFVIATVKGDIHDIGKNIVKLLLENYGFAVCDLGKDVPPEKIVEKTVALHSPIVGLSALMTTTLPAMEETIRLLREKAPWCKIVVGGAVLNEEYAQKIGADKYAKDGMETVRFAEQINQTL